MALADDLSTEKLDAVRNASSPTTAMPLVAEMLRLTAAAVTAAAVVLNSLLLLLVCLLFY